MSFSNQLRKEKMKAMKEKDKLKAGVISLILSNILLEEKEQKKELTDDEAIAFVQKELKQTQDALEQTPKDRIETLEETKRKIEVIRGFLPKQLTEEEIQTEIKKLISEKNLTLDARSNGILIKEMMARFAGRTDGKTVNKLVTEFLK